MTMMGVTSYVSGAENAIGGHSSTRWLMEESKLPLSWFA